MFSPSWLPKPECLASWHDIRRLLGETADVLEIGALFPSRAELEAVQAWLNGGEDFTQPHLSPPVGKIAAILEVLEQGRDVKGTAQ